jgi:hypothetical protein
MNRGLDRRLVALAAAYAVALNTLLAVFTAILPPAASGEIGPAVICSAGGPGWASDSGAPDQPQPLCPCSGACAMPGCAATVLPDHDPTGAATACVSAGLAGREREREQKQVFRPGSGTLARGPPVAWSGCLRQFGNSTGST